MTLTKEEILAIGVRETVLYFTNEHNAEKEAVRNAKNLITGDFRTTYLGTYEGEAFEANGSEVYDGDSVYMSRKERLLLEDALDGRYLDVDDLDDNWFLEDGAWVTVNQDSYDWVESYAEALYYIDDNGLDTSHCDEYQDFIDLARGHQDA